MFFSFPVSCKAFDKKFKFSDLDHSYLELFINNSCKYNINVISVCCQILYAIANASFLKKLTINNYINIVNNLTMNNINNKNNWIRLKLSLTSGIEVYFYLQMEAING